MPLLRVNMLKNKSPKTDISATKNPRIRNSNKLSCRPINNGIKHEKKEAINMPPIKPSTVFPGLILGNKGVFPAIFPTKKAAESATETIIITYKKIPGFVTIKNKDATNGRRIKYPENKMNKSSILLFM